ncbi:hypothetical protein F4809DRAFT_612453 [Biscogniauxia mediterranea]|nr:hypothetical protein F4809DRAFT_612453 [Biscogniauxia mediterranea]
MIICIRTYCSLLLVCVLIFPTLTFDSFTNTATRDYHPSHQNARTRSKPKHRGSVHPGGFHRLSTVSHFLFRPARGGATKCSGYPRLHISCRVERRGG